MLSTQDLPPTHLAASVVIGHTLLPPLAEGAPIPPKEETAIVVVAGGQILGGGTYAIDHSKNIVIQDCWSVSDLTGAHWARLTDEPGVRCLAIPLGVGAAIRASMDRFHADGSRRIKAEADRRQGVLDAVSSLGAAAHNATLQLATAVGRSAGG